MKVFQKLAKVQTVPVISIEGVIDAKLVQKVHNGLQRINPGTAQALAVVVNSPGGQATQSDLIVQKIKLFCKTNKLPLYTFAGDVAASGGYMVLAAGDKVFVDESSLVGSIGVISGSIGYKNLLNHYKVETRHWSTQENLLENIYDPTSEFMNDKQKTLVKQILAGTHQTFINDVESARGDKITLQGEERQKQIYNADVFSGTKAVELGLADKIGQYQAVLFSEFPKANLDFVIKKSLKEQFQDRGVKFSFKLPGLDTQAVSNNQLTNEFLKSFK